MTASPWLSVARSIVDPAVSVSELESATEALVASIRSDVEAERLRLCRESHPSSRPVRPRLTVIEGGAL